jgi:acyl dehydratase
MTERPSSGRIYTNVVLTVIASLLALQVVQQLPVGLVSPAQAQRASSTIDANIPATQDVAVAAATSEVAAANREIAAAIKSVADSMGTLSGALRASAAAASAPAAASRPAASPSDINISVK